MLEGGIDSLEEILTGGGRILGIGRVGTERGGTMMEERMREVVYGDVQTSVCRESGVALGRRGMSFVPL